MCVCVLVSLVLIDGLAFLESATIMSYLLGLSTELDSNCFVRLNPRIEIYGIRVSEWRHIVAYVVYKDSIHLVVVWKVSFSILCRIVFITSLFCGSISMGGYPNNQVIKHLLFTTTVCIFGYVSIFFRILQYWTVGARSLAYPLERFCGIGILVTCT